MDKEATEALKTRATTLYLTASWPIFQRLCREKLGQSGSARLNELMQKDIDRMLKRDVWGGKWTRKTQKR
jgi:hypothetical protein